MLFRSNRERYFSPGTRVFLPSDVRRASHYATANFWLEEGGAILVLNGEKKEIWVPRAGGQKEVLDFALAYAPGLKHATLIETRVGFRPASPSFVPMLGPVEGVRGLLVSNGLGAGGLTLGPMSGRLLAECALGQKTALDLADYAPRA